ncbi:acetyltransferase [Methylorubrum podarium]|uniref:acetyltransferase n=1 Tax=Methylorubrum podarium TaxID=200476 RepID=UPI001EE3371B|nr:acetyltransferase [Methylorubrum podarium]
MEALRRMPAADRESLAQAILTVADNETPLDIDPEHLPAVLEGLAQIERGAYVEGEPEDLVAAAFRRRVP